MKKAGLIIIFILVLMIVVFSTATYAFYSSARAKFTFVIGSEVGSSIGLNLINSENTIKPANTSAQVDNYSALDSNSGERWAVYLVQYNVTSNYALNVDFYIDDVEYADSQGNSFAAGFESYLDTTLQYCIKLESSLTTYHLADGETYLTTNLHTILNSEWKYKYDDTDATSQAATSFNITAPAGVGYVFCYIRFNKSQELIPPQFNGASISFMIESEVV